ncbi:MAG: GNAT family N-acetyltransferase [Bdellovibrionota bacterium]
MSFEIRSATVADAKTCYAHTMRHFAESGVDGDIVFHPMLDSWNSREMKDCVDKFDESWSKPITEMGWERMWLLFDGPDRVVGHASLRSPHSPSGLHRSMLGIGVERHVRGGGWGRKLMQAAISWARDQSSLDYIDLYVFTHNTKAHALYESLGFKEIGTTHDLFRVGSQIIDDIHMVLELK